MDSFKWLVSLTNALTKEVLPVPDGADTINRVPMRLFFDMVLVKFIQSCYSMFWICSRICSMATFKSILAFEVVMLADLEPIVFDSLLSS